MAASLGRIKAQLAEPVRDIPPEMIDLINRNVSPPTAVEPDDVYVRAMYVVSDGVNSYGGCFPVDEHDGLVSLLMDSPVMIGHRKDKLPIARTFHASRVLRDGEHWVKSYFYWLKSAEGTASLKENIDGGIYKECSLAFTYCLPECSICGRDIRQCEHEPLQDYQKGGNTVTCHYNYRQIENVLETSLVYRGAVPGTSVTPDLIQSAKNKVAADSAAGDERLMPIDDLAVLDPSAHYLVVPRYEGIPVSLQAADGDISLQRLDGSMIQHPDLEGFGSCLPSKIEIDHARLLGFRGKERCSLDHIEKHLAGEDSALRRLVLVLYPDSVGRIVTRTDKSGSHSVRMIPYRVCERDELHRRSLEIKSRDGVEIWPIGYKPAGGDGFLYNPRTEKWPSSSYTILEDNQTGGQVLVVQHERLSACFEIVRFDSDRLLRKGRFVARKIENLPQSVGVSYKEIMSGRLSGIGAVQGCYLLAEGKGQKNQLVLRPILLNGEQKFLFYRNAG